MRLQHSDEELEEFWDFNTGTIGLNDIPAMVAKIHSTIFDTLHPIEQCKKVQIVAHGLGSAEALVTLSALPQTSARLISHLINLAPCPIPASQDYIDDRRILASAEAPPRELSEASEDILGDKADRYLRKSRSLKKEKKPKSKSKSKSRSKSPADTSHSHNDNQDEFWNRTERYCQRYPDNCINNWCSWYPYKCDEFCDRFPQWCTPPEVRAQCAMHEVYEDLKIYSKYGPEWEDQVDSLCDDHRVSYHMCHQLRSTVGQGYAEMAIQQLDHMWQVGNSREFDEYSGEFCEGDGWQEDAPEFPLDQISSEVVMTNIYVKDDPVCWPETQQALLDSLSDVKYTTMNASVTHSSIAAANDQGWFVNLLKFSLSEGANFNVDGFCFDNLDWY